MIDWKAFDWQSFATLMAGAFAVAGAVVVGLRQTAVLRKQAEIAELTLRHDLFEKRYAVFETTRDFLAGIVQTGDRMQPEMERQFLRAMGESIFLFRPSVNEDLREIWKRYSAFVILKADMDRTYRGEAHHGDGNPKRKTDMLTAFHDDISGLRWSRLLGQVCG